MMKMSELKPENKHMLCFVGKGGHGKSIGASYWPTPMLYLSCDNRASAVYNWWINREGGKEKLKEIDIDTYTAKEYDKLAQKFENLQLKNPYRTIVLDPLTYVGDMLIQYGMSGRGTIPNRKDGSKNYVPTAQIEDYKTESHGLKILMDVGRVLNSHFILCAHILEETHHELNTEKPRVVRSLVTAGKKAAASLPAMFDEMWLFSIRPALQLGQRPDYRIITAPNAEFDSLRTSCGMPTEIIWTDKNLYELASPNLNKKEVLVK